MNKEAMNWKTFKETLLQHTDLDLQFQYGNNQWVDASYHITEIKQAPITSVDCGGLVNSWTEIIIQLYEPENSRQLRAMKVHKAMDIINLVEKALPLNIDAIIKIEFGNAAFDTRQLLPNGLFVDGDNLIVDLRTDTVQCKAIGRGGSCGTGEKTKVEPKKLTVIADKCCTPGGSCC